MNKLVMVVCVILSLIILSTISGCTYAVGNRQITDSNAVSKITVGKSTKNDVQQAFGEPMKTSFTETGEIWDYTYSRSDTRATSFIPYVGLFAGGTDTQNHTLTIVFNKDGIVKEIGRGKTTGGGGGIQDMGK